MPTQLTAYTIDELTGKAKDRAIEHYRHVCVVHDDWDEDDVDRWKKKLIEMGFTDPDIRCSGFASQGDGASFTCSYVDIAKLLKATKTTHRFRLILLAEELGYNVHLSVIDRSSDRYVHRYSVEAYLEDGVRCDQEALRFRVEQLMNTLEEETTALVRELSDKIYNCLEEEHRYLTSDEAVEENVESRGYLFTEGGARIEGETV